MGADAAAFGPLADAGERFVEGDDHGGEWTRPVGNEQIAFQKLSVRVSLHLELVLKVAVALDLFQLLDRWLLHHRRPGSQTPVPGFQDLAPTPCPLGRRRGAGAVSKLERRSVGAELASEF